MTAATVEWEPGEPLHAAGHHGGYLFNFREDTESTICCCGDAAMWTVDPAVALPARARPLSDGDELGAFIAEHHAWVEAGCP